jgi:MFS family permease
LRANNPVLTAPVRRVTATFIIAYALGFTGMWLALLTPVLITIAVRMRELAPQHAAQSLAQVLAIGAAVALIGNPLFGHLSDRTRSRWGMRRPWMVGGMICGSAGLAIIASANHVWVVVVGWCLAQLAFNAVLAALVAVLPDQVPSDQRGLVSGVLAVCMPIGQALGVVLVHYVSTSTWAAYMLPACLGTAAVLVFAYILPDRRQLADDVRPASLPGLLRAFWVSPRTHPDFAWAWSSRLALVMGSALLTTYLPFYLSDKLGFAAADVPALVSQAVVIQAVMTVAFSLLCGRLSDAFGRRKFFVLGGSVCYALGFWAIATADSHGAFLIGVVIIGAAHGTYFGTDLALVTEILRDRRRHSGSDLGVLNITNALPQVIAPPLGTLSLSLAGGDFGWLYFVAASWALVSALALLPLKSVR